MDNLATNLNVSSGPITVAAEQVAIRAQAIAPGETPSFGISTGSDGNFGDDPFAESDAPAATVDVPGALTTDNPDVSRLGLASFTDDALFQDDDTEVGSIVLSFNAVNDNGEIVTVRGLASPIMFTFRVTGDADLATCSFYNTTSKLFAAITIQ